MKIVLLGPDGQVLRTMFHQKPFEYGKYTEQVEVEGLPAGTYWVTLTGDGRVIAKKMVVVK